MKRDLKPPRRLSARVFPALAFLVLALPGVSRADTLEDASRQLARKVAAALAPRETVLVSVRNLSSLSPFDVAEARRAFEAELSSRGLLLAGASASHQEVRVTLAENLEGYLWVAEIPGSDGNRVEMVSLSRPLAPSGGPGSPGLVIEKKLLWEQEGQIVDIALLGPAGATEQRMAILEPARVALYDQKEGRWSLRQEFPIHTGKNWPRDLRGRLYHVDEESAPHGAETLSVFLPGVHCVLALKGAPGAPELSCALNDRRVWLISAGSQLTDNAAEFVTDRNYFTGQLFGEAGPRARVEPFFSATLLPRERGPTLILFAGLDGKTRWYENPDEKPVGTVKDWGTDLVSVQANCGSAWQVLATRSRDWTEADAVTAYAFVGQQMVPESPAAELPGPVIVLSPETLAGWGEPTMPRGGAIAVVRNLQTGHYEAYQLLVACSR